MLSLFRAYKLRHFLRGSGASETESERSHQVPPAEVASEDVTDAVQQTVPLSAVDRLSLNPERGILKNSLTNSMSRRTGAARGSKSVTTYQPVADSDTSRPPDIDNCSVDVSCIETDKGRSDLPLTDIITSTPIDATRSHSPQHFSIELLRTSPVPSSIQCTSPVLNSIQRTS